MNLFVPRVGNIIFLCSNASVVRFILRKKCMFSKYAGFTHNMQTARLLE